MLLYTQIFIFFTAIYSSVIVVKCQTTTVEDPKNISTAPPQHTLYSDNSTITPTSNETSCKKYNDDCKACVTHNECYYCKTDNKCKVKLSEFLTEEKCNLKEINYKTCRVNLQYLAIGIGILTLVAILIISIFCCYCCCKRKGVKISKDDLKWARRKEERQQIALEKRQERAERTEEIRKKYGLAKESNPYKRFDA